jgi:hypothetical protein
MNMKHRYLLQQSLAHVSVIAIAISASPVSAAPSAVGDIFAAIGNGQVNHYTNSGTFIETLNTGQGGFTTGMAFDDAGNLYVTNFSAGNITRFDTNGAILPPNPFASPGASNESIVFSAGGDFYVGRAGGQFQRYSATGTLEQTYSTPVNTDWIDLAANQTTMFYNDEGGLIRRWNLTTDAALADFANNGANGGTNSFALRILQNGSVLSAAGSRVNEYDSTGMFLGSYDVTGVDGFFALNLDPNGTSFWTGSFNNQTLYRFNIGSFGVDTDTATLVTGGQLFGVALAGEITVGNPGVPEPATWALMVAGFGMAGAAMRRSRKISVTPA